MRHPRDMGAAEVEAFLNMLANERRISASTHNQALRIPKAFELPGKKAELR